MCRCWRRSRVADDLDIPPHSVVTLQLADVAWARPVPHITGVCAPARRERGALVGSIFPSRSWNTFPASLFLHHLILCG